jgi:hypothetical protein
MVKNKNLKEKNNIYYKINLILFLFINYNKIINEKILSKPKCQHYTSTSTP